MRRARRRASRSTIAAPASNSQTGKPNSLAGRKRPLHTIIPAFMQKDDISIGFGIMGGWNQSQAHAQFVANVVDFGMNVQMALESARFTKVTFEGCDVQMESRIPDAVRQELARRGHVITPLGGFAERHGQRRGCHARREERRQLRRAPIRVRMARRFPNSRWRLRSAGSGSGGRFDARRA